MSVNITEEIPLPTRLEDTISQPTENNLNDSSLDVDNELTALANEFQGTVFEWGSYSGTSHEIITKCPWAKQAGAVALRSVFESYITQQENAKEKENEESEEPDTEVLEEHTKESRKANKSAPEEKIDKAEAVLDDEAADTKIDSRQEKSSGVIDGHLESEMEGELANIDTITAQEKTSKTDEMEPVPLQSEQTDKIDMPTTRDSVIKSALISNKAASPTSTRTKQPPKETITTGKREKAKSDGSVKAKPLIEETKKSSAPSYAYEVKQDTAEKVALPALKTETNFISSGNKEELNDLSQEFDPTAVDIADPVVDEVIENLETYEQTPWEEFSAESDSLTSMAEGEDDSSEDSEFVPNMLALEEERADETVPDTPSHNFAEALEKKFPVDYEATLIDFNDAESLPPQVARAKLDELFQSLEPEKAEVANDMVDDIMQTATKLRETHDSESEDNSVEEQELGEEIVEVEQKLREQCIELFELLEIIDYDEETLEQFIKNVAIEQPPKDIEATLETPVNYAEGTREQKLNDYSLLNIFTQLAKQSENPLAILGRYVLQLKPALSSV